MLYRRQNRTDCRHIRVTRLKFQLAHLEVKLSSQVWSHLWEWHKSAINTHCWSRDNVEACCKFLRQSRRSSCFKWVSFAAASQRKYCKWWLCVNRHNDLWLNLYNVITQYNHCILWEYQGRQGWQKSYRIGEAFLSQWLVFCLFKPSLLPQLHRRQVDKSQSSEYGSKFGEILGRVANEMLRVAVKSAIWPSYCLCNIIYTMSVISWTAAILDGSN